MPKERNDDGQYVETATLEDVRGAFDAIDAPPVVTTADVADETGLSRDSARRKLELLRERDDVARRRSAGRVLYWPAEWTRRPLADEEAAESGSGGAVTSTSSAPDSHPSEDTDGQQSAVTTDEDLRKMVRGADGLAGSGDLLERRVDAILAMYAHLREHGSAEKDGLLNAVDVDATDYAGPGSVWSNMIKGKDTLRALPGVQKPSTGKTTWRYDPEGEGET